MQTGFELIEVGPRDGFQNVKTFIPTMMKLSIIDRIVAAGAKHIQATSFVNPKAISQMKDAAIVMESCKKRHPEIDFFALVPNYRGVETAVDCGTQKVSFVISVSEAHNKANVNKTVDQSFEELARVVKDFPDLEICLDAATAFGCPFGTEVSYDMVSEFVKRGLALGIREFCLCDTIGVAVPSQVRRMVTRILNDQPSARFQIHIHDTRGMGIANTLAAIEAGIMGAQTALGGQGGCPFAPGATGNTASEDLLWMLNRMGVETGIDDKAYIAAAKYLRDNVPDRYSGHQIMIAK